MSAACIAYNNLADTATVTASTQALLMPASNLQNPHVARKWRSLLPTASVVFTLSAAASIDSFGIFGINAETIRIRVSAVDSTGAAGEIYDSGTHAVDAAYNSFIGLKTTPASARYVLIELTTTSADYVEAGRIFIGARTQFAISFGWSWERARVDRSIRAKTRGGQTQVNPDTLYRTLNVTFGFASDAEANGIIETIDRVNGLQTDVLFIIDPTSTNLPRDSYWGLIMENSPVVNSSFGINSKQYKIEERL